MLDQGTLMDVLRQGLWTAVVVSAPVLTVALVVGLVIGLFQALTSIQELTLTFVPKLGAIVVAFWVALDMMSMSLKSFFRDSIIPLIAGGGSQ